VRADRRELFPLRPDIVMFNHASYGLATTALLAHTQALRIELEADPNVRLGEPLQDRLHEVLTGLCAHLGLPPEHTALTSSATCGAAAVQRSLPLAAGDVVIALDCEYSSVLRGWQQRCDEVGAQLRVVPVPLPLTDVEDLLSRMTAAAAGDRVAVLQFSAITSSAALRLPVSRLAAWGHQHGATAVVDAAHAPGHVDVAAWDDVDVAFGTLHKWFPVPRSVGILWTSPELSDRIYPAEVSLTYDAPTLDRRFAWPGTYDPAARLAVPDAVAAHTRWATDGDLDRARELADRASATLTGAGAIPTGGDTLLPPRLRAFLLPGVPAPALRQRLHDAGIRAWTGEFDENASLLRLATHVYNDPDDVEAITRAVAPLLAPGTGGA
jgi:isopenicillin-N epimerase